MNGIVVCATSFDREVGPNLTNWSEVESGTEALDWKVGMSASLSNSSVRGLRSSSGDFSLLIQWAV